MDRYVAMAAADMTAARDELLAALAQITPSDWDRFVPYGARTLHELLAHLAGADQTWALAAQGLLKGEGEERVPLTRAAATTARDNAILRGRSEPPAALIAEMHRRRKLLLSLFELLEPRHLALALPAFGEEHNSVRERIWLGYHDRLHAADVRRALRMRWHPARLRFLPEVTPEAEALSPDETLYVIYSVDPVQWERPSQVPGWTHRGLLAHIATGDWVLQTHLRHITEHGSVAQWPDIDAGNAERLAQRAQSTTTKLADEYLSMRHETMLLLGRIQPKHLSLPLSFWWEPQPNQHTVLEYLQHFPVHERHHREQMRRAMKYAR
jgi:uncharacterized damage-inducible protein DinB